MAKDKDNFLMKKDWGYQFFDEEYPIDDATAGRMLKLMYAKILGIDYDPDLERSEKRAVNEWLRVINENEEAYRKKCKRNSENVSNRWQSNENDTTVYDRIRNDTTVYKSNETVRIDTDTDTDTDTDSDIDSVTGTGTGFESDSDSDSEIPPYNPPKGKRKRFVKPTVEEVSEYCAERQNDIDPEEFVDFYESKGWKVGREPMKDWKACVRTWEKSHRHRPREKPKFNTDNYLMSIAMGGTA